MEIKPLYVPLEIFQEIKALAKSRSQFIQATTLEIVEAGLKAIRNGKKTKPAKQ